MHTYVVNSFCKFAAVKINKTKQLRFLKQHKTSCMQQFLNVGLYSLIMWLFACAKVGAPTGGVRDNEAPKVVSLQPQNNSTGFSSKKISITFDEFVQLDNISQNLLVSPPLKTKPEVKIDGKGIKIMLNPDELKDSTTYNLFFGNAIKDLHEGNVLPAFSYSFSTGKTIDTLQVSGTLFDAFTRKPVSEAYVMLYSNLNDSAPKKEVPRYITKSQKDGTFVLTNIKKGQYRLYALKDLNNNLMFDQVKETIALYDTLVSPSCSYKTISDTIKRKGKADSVSTRRIIDYKPHNIALYGFTEEKKIQYISNSTRSKREKIQIVWNLPLVKDSFSVSFISQAQATDTWIKEFSQKKDTVTLWLQSESLRKNDTLALVVSYFKHDSLGILKWKGDTIKPRYNARQDKQRGHILCLLTSGIKKNEELFPNQKLSFEVNNPVADINESNVQLFQARDTNSIQTSKGQFYELDKNNAEIVAQYSLPRVKPFKATSFDESQKITKYQSGKNKFLISFQTALKASDSVFISIDGRNEHEWAVREKDQTSNSFFYWITDQNLLNRKSFTMMVYFNAKPLDTLLFEKPKLANFKASSGGLKPAVPSLQMLGLCLDEYIPLQIVNPIAHFDASSIVMQRKNDTAHTPIPCEFFLFKNYPRTLFIKSKLDKAQTYTITFADNAIEDIFGNKTEMGTIDIKTQILKSNYLLTVVPIKSIKPDSINARKYNIDARLEDNKKYLLRVFPEAITDVYGKKNDSLNIIFKTPVKENYGTLAIDIKGISTHPVIVQLWDSEEKNMITAQWLVKNGLVQFTSLKPGTYLLKAVMDKNANKVWDTGSLLDHKQAETVTYYQNDITIKANWDSKTTWDISSFLPKRDTEAPKTK